MPSKRLLSVPETAEFFGLTATALYDQRYHDREPGNLGIPIGGRVMFLESDLWEYVDRQKRNSGLRLNQTAASAMTETDW